MSSSPEIVFQQFEVPVSGGRKIAVWRSANIDRALRRVPILVTSGFARRMSSFSPLAQYLAINGFEVFRYDPLDHIGLSSGEMKDFTLSTGLESMRLVVDWLRKERELTTLGVVATSLSSRIAYRLIGTQPGFEFLVTAVGVTHVAATLKEVFGEDYSKWRPEDLPDYVEFEKRHRVNGPPFYRDGFENRWWGLEPTVEELRHCKVPIQAFLGNDDPWVKAEDVHQALAGDGSATRKISTLTGSGHDLGRNAAVAREFFCEMTRACIALSGTEQWSTGPELSEPSFEDISRRMIEERRLQQPHATQSEVAKPVVQASTGA
jgi:acyl transferase